MVAFLTSKADVRVVDLRSGKSRLLARDVFAPDKSAAIAWAPDSRYLATGSPSNAVIIVDVERGGEREVPLGSIPGRAGFSPDSSKLLVEARNPRSTDLEIVSVSNGHDRELPGGEGPAWGPDGFAYRTSLDGMLFQRTPGAKPTRLHEGGHALPRDWSDDGETLLAVGGTAPDALRALLINRRSRHARFLPKRFSAVESLSSNGRVVLGERGGNVVAAWRNGSTKVLAHNAATPSWTK
jgi:WD40 repeat protein